MFIVEIFIINKVIQQESKKFKRLKKGQRDTEDEPSGLSDEEEFDGSGKGGRTAEEKLKRSLFGDDEGMLKMLLVYSIGFPLLIMDVIEHRRST